MCARTTLQIIVFFTTSSKNCTAYFLGKLSCVANIFKHFVGQTLSLGGGRERVFHHVSWNVVVLALIHFGCDMTM